MVVGIVVVGIVVETSVVVKTLVGAGVAINPVVRPGTVVRSCVWAAIGAAWGFGADL